MTTCLRSLTSLEEDRELTAAERAVVELAVQEARGDQPESADRSHAALPVRPGAGPLSTARGPRAGPLATPGC